MNKSKTHVGVLDDEDNVTAACAQNAPGKT